MFYLPDYKLFIINLFLVTKSKANILKRPPSAIDSFRNRIITRGLQEVQHTGSRIVDSGLQRLSRRKMYEGDLLIHQVKY